MTTRLLSLCLLLPIAALAQQQPQIPTLQAHARAVLLDVVVTDGHGHAIHGLKAGDFDVLEDQEAQDIASFEEIRPTPLLTPPPKLPHNTWSNATPTNQASSYTVLLLDGLNTRLADQSFAHGELEKYLKTAVLTGPIAIFQLGTQLRMIQGFTTDVDRLTQAVKERDKLLLTAIPLSGGYVATRFRQDYLTAGLRDLGTYLATYPGRKNLIWLTGSVPLYAYEDASGLGGALHDRELFTTDTDRATDLLTIGRVSVYPVDSEGLPTNPAFSAARRGAPSIGEITNWSVNQSFRHEDLDEVAKATGGKAFYNNNALHSVIAEVVETGSNYYTLTYYPTNKNWDGKLRKVDIHLDQPGQLEYRRGYYAKVETGRMQPTPGSTPPPLSRAAARRQLTHHDDPSAFEKSMQLGAVDPGTIVFQAHVDERDTLPDGAQQQNYLDPKYAKKPIHYYDINYTVAAKDIELHPNADGIMQGKVEFVVVVLDDKGALVNSQQAIIEMNMKPQTYAYVQANGMQMPVRVAVPVKGNYFLRAGVHDQVSGKSGALEVAASEVKP